MTCELGELAENGLHLRIIGRPEAPFAAIAPGAGKAEILHRGRSALRCRFDVVEVEDGPALVEKLEHTTLGDRRPCGPLPAVVADAPVALSDCGTYRIGDVAVAVTHAGKPSSRQRIGLRGAPTREGVTP